MESPSVIQGMSILAEEVENPATEACDCCNRDCYNSICGGCHSCCACLDACLQGVLCCLSCFAVCS